MSLEKLGKISNCIFILFFYIIFVLVMGNMTATSEIALLLFAPFLLLLWRLGLRFHRRLDKINYKYASVFLWIVSAVLMLWIMFGVEVRPAWDWGQLLRSASRYVLKGKIDNLPYYARYICNQTWLLCLIVWFKGVKFIYPDAGFWSFKVASMFLSFFLVQASMRLIYKSARLIWSEKKAFLVYLFTALCAPLYLYAQFAYTDAPGIFCAALLIYLYLKLMKAEGRKRVLYWGAIGILAALTWKLKMVIFILVVAILIDAFLKMKNWKKFVVEFFVFLLCCGCMFGVTTKAVESKIVISEKQYDKYQFPLTHNIMMALSGVGGYNGADVAYTSSFPTYEERQEATVAEIKKRISEKGLKGMIKHVLGTKLLRTWSDPTMAGNYYVTIVPKKEDGFCAQFFRSTGSLHWIFLIYASLYHMTMLGAILASAFLVFSRKNKGQVLMFCRLAILGQAIFMSIWECNSRYLMAFIPVLVLAAAEGLFLLWNRITGRLQTKKAEDFD